MKTLVSFALLVCLLGGCATSKFMKPTKDDVAALRGERRDDAMRQFEIHRDTAQYQAAMDRWQAGDPFTCEAQLRSLVSRNPNNMEAQRALADLAMERGDAAAAEAQLRELLKISPDDAQTHHSLGLLLELRQQHEESRRHLAKAAELAPDNTLYQLCLADPLAPALPSAPAAEVIAGRDIIERGATAP